MANNKMSGNLLGVKIKNEFISCEISCELNFETDMRAVSSIASGRWKDFIPGLRSWNVNVNAAMLLRMAGTGINTILNAFITGEKMDIEFSTKRLDLPNFIIRGQVYVQSGSISGSVNSLANWNTILQGSGPFTIAINDNIVYAISATLNDDTILEDGNENFIVSSNYDN